MNPFQDRLFRALTRQPVVVLDFHPGLGVSSGELGHWGLDFVKRQLATLEAQGRITVRRRHRWHWFWLEPYVEVRIDSGYQRSFVCGPGRTDLPLLPVSKPRTGPRIK